MVKRSIVVLTVVLSAAYSLPVGSSTVPPAGPVVSVTDSTYNGHHPRLLFTRNEIAGLQSKVRDGGYDDDAFAFVGNMAENYYPLISEEAALSHDYGMTALPLLGVATYLSIPEDLLADSLGQNITIYIADNYDVDFDEAGSALRLHALSFGYDMFFRDAPDSLREYVRNEMTSYMETMARSSPYQLWRYRPYLANHSAMVAGAVGLAAVCLADEADSILIADAFAAADGIVDSLLTYQIDSEGSYKEGALYAGWTMRNLVYYFHARKRFDGFNWADQPRIRRLERWLAYEVLPEGDARLHNLNDCTYYNFPLSYHTTYFDWAQSEWGSNLSAWIWEHVAGPYGVNLGVQADKVGTVMWNQNLTPQQPDSVLSKSFLWEDRGLYHYRTGWQSGAASNDVMFTFFSGKFHGGHAQEDHNQFSLYGYGERFVIDHGPGSLGKQSEAHNMIFIDGKGQHNAGYSIGTDGRISAFILNDFADYIQGDATKAYTTHSPFNNPDYPFPGWDWSWGYDGGNPVDHAYRNVVAVHDAATPPYFIITDDIDKDGSAHEYQWQLHTLSTNAVDIASDPIRIAGSSGHLAVYSAGHDFAALGVTTTPFDNQTSEPDATLIRLSTTAVNPHFAFILIPGDGSIVEPAVTQERYAWGSASRIDWGNGIADCFLFNPSGATVCIATARVGTGRSHRDVFDEPGPTSGTPTGDHLITIDAPFALFRLEYDVLSGYFVANASRFLFDRNAYIRVENGRVNCAFSGNRIDIDREDAEFLFYGPEVTELMYHGEPIPFIKMNSYIMPATNEAPIGAAEKQRQDVVVRIHPNPFNPSTQLSIELSRPSLVRITVYDVSGRTV
ncbi:MAG: heparinase II/III family protein, partial [Candidatus Latescibacterota bacterium]